jgi:hypothetical protein
VGLEYLAAVVSWTGGSGVPGGCRPVETVDLEYLAAAGSWTDESGIPVQQKGN